MNLLSTFANSNLEDQIKNLSIQSVMVASLILITLVLISSRVIKDKNKKNDKFKKPLFILISLTIIIPSLYMTGSTIVLNTVSDSKGPVHWHTDIEFWVCDQEIELRDPYAFLSNKVGTSTYHEHDDKRIHLEGVVIDKEIDASLGKLMQVTGGSISSSELVVPTNDDQIFEDDTDGDVVSGDEEQVRKFVKKAYDDGKERTTVAMKNGDGCTDQGYGEVQAFLIRFNKEDDTYTQTKLDDPASYIMRDESTVPPGDCVIVEFDKVKSKTDKLCQQYGIRDVERCVSFGVSEFNPELCNIREVENSQFREAVDELFELEDL